LKNNYSLERITKFFNGLSQTLTDKDNYSLKKVICYITIIISILLIGIGFTSAVNSYYIGDTTIFSLLLVIALFLSFQVIYSIVKLKQRIKIISMLIFTILLFILAYLIPTFPPFYDLRTYDVDASLFKFLITSIMMIIVGVLSVKYSMKTYYDFTSKSEQSSAYFILIFSILLILYPLAIIVSSIISNGVSGITWEFLTEDFSRHGTKGGVFPNIIGTFLLIIGTAVIALPLGISCAIYLNEYAKAGIITRIIRIAVDILQGIPSIVHGLFGLALFVPLFGRCLLTGILILSFLTLPIIIRASEEALRSVPQDLREGSYALGGTKWQTIRRVVLPPAIPGIITGGVLGLGRAAGETAPIMFTAAFIMGAGVPNNLFDGIQTLPTHLLELTRKMGAYEVEQNAWATAFLLLAIVLGMNAVSIIIREKFRVEF